MTNVGRLGAVFGGTYPAITWQKFMSSMLAGTPVESFLPPDPSLWPVGRYVSENGRGTTRSTSGDGSNRGTTRTTRPAPFFGFPPPSSSPAPPPASLPPATGPTGPPSSTP
jgi:hypothetical protein